MYRNAPKFTTEQELATRYWWNITQLAAAAVQDVFLIIYTAMEDTDNGTKSIAAYCSEHGKNHVMKELKGEGYDLEKLSTNPKDVFFDLQLTRKVMDKIIVDYVNKDIINKMRKKIRWVVYQRNDVCHEMLQPLEISQLKLKLGSLKGVLRQLYNLASQYANMDKGDTDSALACFLEELEEHRLLALATEEKFKRRNFKRRFRKKYNPGDGDSSEDKDETDDDSEIEDSLCSSEKDDCTDNSENSERRDSQDTAIWLDERNISETTAEMLNEDENVTRENERNGGMNNNNNTSYSHSQSVYAAEGSLNPTYGARNVCNTEGDFQELWRAQGSTVMVQVGLYCSKGFQNHFESIQAKLQSADQIMVFWQKCLCESHESRENTPKRYFVPPRISVRTRSKSLGRKAAQYLLKYQRMRRRKYKAKIGHINQGKQGLGSIVDDVRITMPDIQKGVFGNQWEDTIRREEAILAIENWETLIAEDEWENEWWGDFEHINTLGSSCLKKQISIDSDLQCKNEHKAQAQNSSNAIQDTRRNFCGNNCESYVITSSVASATKTSPTIAFIAVSILSLLLFSLITFLTFITTYLFVVAFGRVITELLNVFVIISFIFSLGSTVGLVFVIVAFLTFTLETVHKIVKVLRFFITYCYELEQQASKRLGKTYYVVRD